MTQTHTPGPWHISADGNDVENAIDAGVCAIYADETSESNARLIAAAPDMLAALKKIAERPNSPDGMVAIAVAAIAKAEGR